jgi:Methyltransferase domain
MSSLAITRIGEELLDDPAADPAAVTESLRNISRANRWFGGSWAVRYGLQQALHGIPLGTSLSLIDLGTGLGDLPRVAVGWARRRGIRLIPVGLERSRVAAALASRTGLPTALACAGAPPLRDKSVDVVLVSQLAHHLTSASVMHLFRTCDRLARRAVIIADLRRHSLAAPAFWCGARLLRFDPVTLVDGMTSIRRGFRPDELRDLLRRAGVDARVRSRPGFRLVATWIPKDA